MNKTRIYTLTTCALMAALMCIFGPMSIPIGTIPISFTNLIIYFSVFLLGTKAGTISYLIYMLLGAVGLPVFSGFTGGLAKLTGPTGGYLVGFILIALIGGLIMEHWNRNVIVTFVGMAAGTAVAYALGTIWFVILMKTTAAQALAVCVYPFIPFDLIKIALAILLGKTVRAALVKSGLIPADRK